MLKKKVRGIILIDYIVEGYEGIAKEKAIIDTTIKNMCAGNINVVKYETDIRERRVDDLPDIAKVKIRM